MEPDCFLVAPSKRPVTRLVFTTNHTIMNTQLNTLLSDPDFVDQATKRLSVKILCNLMPWDSARLLVELLESKSLKQYLNAVEREALGYYEKYLSLNLDHVEESSIRFMSSTLVLKSEIAANEVLNDNWKRNIADDFGDAYDTRDTLACLYCLAKERSESPEVTANQHYPSQSAP